MQTTTIQHTRGTPSIPTRMPTPPPAVRRDLRDAEVVMGWIDGMALGFHGFADENEAAHAAWVAYRAMARLFARKDSRRLIPIDSVPLSLGWSEDAELIMAAGRPIATLVRPGTGSPSGPDSFGFELRMPMPADELTVRSTAHLVYLTLRRSGIRWAMWTRAPRDATTHRSSEATVTTSAAATSDSSRVRDDDTRKADVARELSRHGATRAAAARLRDDSTGILGAVLVIVALIVAVILPAITTTTLVPLLGGIAGLIAIAALGSLAHLVVTDVRDAFRRRRRAGGASGTALNGHGRLPTAPRMAGAAPRS